MSDFPKPTRRQFLRTASATTVALPLSLDALIQDASQREEPQYSINLDEEILSYDGKDEQAIFRDRLQDLEVLKGTLDEIREQFRFLVARGMIPNLRLIYTRIEEIAQLMSRDRLYLANPENGFEFVKDGYWSPRNTDGVEKKEIGGFPLNYKKENIFIGGTYYNLFLWLVGNPLNNGAVEIKDLFDVGIVPSKIGGRDTSRYYWTARPGQNHEEFVEQRFFSTGRWLYISSTLNANPAALPGKRDSLVYMLDFSGTIQPLIKALERQVVYFDKEWNPVSQR